MVTPRVYVASPTVQPARYGLLSVVQRPPTEGAHWQLGVEWQSDACGQPQLWPGACSAVPPPQPQKVFDDGRPVEVGDPFVVYSGFRCRLVGAENPQDLVRRRFALLEPRGVER